MNQKCATIQLVSTPCVEDNLKTVEKLINEAVSAGAKLVALPENFAFMGQNAVDVLKIKEPFGVGLIQDFLAQMAQKYGVWIVAGTIPLATEQENKVRASCLVFNTQGICVARYDKVHLFDVNVPNSQEVYRESDTFQAGDESLVIDTPFGKLGIAICYDLRFPELFRNMVKQGVNVFVVPAAFTAETGAAHWELLLRARAVENLCYMIAPNQGGHHVNGRKTFGHSMIVDPWGAVLDCYKTGHGFALAGIDLERLEKIRGAFPVLTHRRFFCE